jgi:hypothetical protein
MLYFLKHNVPLMDMMNFFLDIYRTLLLFVNRWNKNISGGVK